MFHPNYSHIFVEMYSYFIIYKPYKMLSQFVRIPKKRVLADLNFTFPEGTNALGRLDENSEGLLILSNEKQLVNLLLKPENLHKRVYWVQVHGKVTIETLQKLEAGISIRMHKEDYVTKPCTAKIIETPPNLPLRGHAVRDDITTTWVELTLTEGKFHHLVKILFRMKNPKFFFVQWKRLVNTGYFSKSSVLLKYLLMVYFFRPQTNGDNEYRTI